MGPPVRPDDDPLADYRPDWRSNPLGQPGLLSWQNVQHLDDPLADYKPGWEHAVRAPKSALQLAREGLERWQAQAESPEVAAMSTGERAKAFATGVGRMAAAPITFAAGAAQATFAPLTPEEARAPGAEARALRFGPDAARNVRNVAARPTVPAEQGQPSAPEALLQGLNPLPMLGRALQRDPEALGELGGLYVGGKVAGEAARRLGPRAGTNVAPSWVMGEAEAAGAHPDPFRTLGLDPRTATHEDVHAAWLARIRDVHPDVNPSPEAATLASRYNVARGEADKALDALQARPVQERQAAPPAEPVSRKPAPAAAPEPPPPAPAQPAATAEELIRTPLPGKMPHEMTPAEQELNAAVGQAQRIAASKSQLGPLVDFSREERETAKRVTAAQTAVAAEQAEPVQPPQLGRTTAVPEPLHATSLRIRPDLNELARQAGFKSHQDVLAMSDEEIRSYIRLTKHAYRDIEDQVLGPELAATYNKAYSKANSPSEFDESVLAEADRVVGEIESSMTPAQREVVFGRALGKYANDEWAQDLLRSRILGREGPAVPRDFPPEVEAANTRIEPGAPHDQAAIQEGLFGEPTLAGKEQAELLPETAGQPTARLKPEKIAPEEVGRVRRQGAEPAGERPAELPLTEPPPAKKGRRKPLEKQSREELLDYLHDQEQILQNPSVSPAQWARMNAYGEMQSPAGGGLGAHILEEAHARAGRITAELQRRGEDDVVSALEQHLEGKAEREGMQYEELARGQRSAFGPKHRTRLIEKLVRAGFDRAAVEAMRDRQLAEAALDSATLTPQEESQVMDVVFGMPETGALRRPVNPRPTGTPDNGIGDAFRRMLSPEGRGPDAKTAARLLRKRIGEYRRALAIDREELKQARKDVPSLDTKEGIAWYDRAEGGQGQVTPKLQAANDILRRRYDEIVRDVQSLLTGKLDDPIENYLAHIWEDPVKARNVMAQIAARRPLRGGASFLKQRTIPTLVEGMRLGLRPVTLNPIDLQLLKMREMRRYVLAQRFLADMKAEGLAKFYRLGDNGPAGWDKVDDPVFTVWGRTAAGELVLRGHYWMPNQSAQVVRNYLSVGLRGNPIFDAYMGLGNSLNAFQLGASGFHAGFSTFTGAISRVALNLGKLRSARQPFLRPSKAGLLGGSAGALLGGATGGAGGATLGALLGSTGARMVAQGLGLRRAYLTPGSGSVLEQKLAEMMERAGGQHVMDPTYKVNALVNLRKAARRGNVPLMLGNTLALIMEKLAWPTMEFYVPLIKLGAFAQLAQSEITRLGPLATDAEVDTAMQDIWHTIDNRFGQVSYDTRFWNNAIKHALMGTVRAVGWDVGTIDEHLGGGVDILKGKPSLRSDFFFALPLTIAFISILIQYALTGHGPESLQDLFEPRDGTKDALGNPNRLTPASYMKDLIAVGRHPVQTVEHKLHPILSFMAGLLENRTFYGDQVRNPTDPIGQQLQQVGKYILDEFKPISVANVEEARRRGETGGRALLPFIGITPASREAERTVAQNLMSDYLTAGRPQGGTPEDAERRQLRAEALRDLRGGRPTPDLGQHGFTRRQERDLFKQARGNPLIEAFKRLDAEQAQKVYDLGTPEEQALWGRVLMTKLHNQRRP